MKYQLSTILILCLAFPEPILAQAPEITPQQVREAIQKGIDFLKRTQDNQTGNWERFNAAPIQLGDYTGGVTALATIALLESGVPPSDPVMKKALDYLEKLPPKKTYVASLQAIALSQADPQRYGPKIREIIDWLIQVADASAQGSMIAWGYPMGGINRPDHSNTQYAVLALREAHAAGITVKPEIWQKVKKMYLASQNASGGWGYNIEGDGSERLTMTSAGVCGLLICDMSLPIIQGPPNADGEYANCGMRDVDNEKAIERGLRQIGNKFNIDIGRNIFQGTSFPFYNIYGIERVGRFSGLRFFNRGGTMIDWYRQGVKTLLAVQSQAGKWESRALIDGDPVLATSFSLLFLAKGKMPILVQKIAHGPTPRGYTGNWNIHHNDVRNLTDFCSKQVFKKENRAVPMTWQIFDAARQAVGRDVSQDVILQDLLQAPICYINGSEAPKFSEGEKTLLKRYVEQGGFILAEACCGSGDFDQGFRKLCKELFPDRELTPLAAGHPIWNAAFPVEPGSFSLQGIDLGCKTCLAYAPKGISSHWEANLHKEFPKTKLAFHLGANIVAYATGLEPPEDKLSKKTLVQNEESAIQRNFLQIAQVNYGSKNWQPAPNAMRVLMTEASKQGLDVILQTKALTLDDADLFNSKFLYMHGRGDFTWTEEQSKRLRGHLENGGALLCDACCGDKTFDKRFRENIKATFGRELEAIPISDPLYSKRVSGKEIQRLNCRTESGKAYAPMEPALEGIRLDPKDPTSPWVVMYSKYDIGCALDRHASADCVGYQHESALELAMQVLLYAMKE
ncbi:MAG: DUF4159 domain-containing protein [Planctomycetia bacterium]|nr:DUF4159 domain-containing protein [Planctomycetia bacterium]